MEKCIHLMKCILFQNMIQFTLLKLLFSANPTKRNIFFLHHPVNLYQVSQMTKELCTKLLINRSNLLFYFAFPKSYK